MAKFYVDDHTNVSTDQILDKCHMYDTKDIVGTISDLNDTDQTKLINDLNAIRTIPDQAFRIPHGNKNYVRLGNIHIGDLLHHVQKGLNERNICILQLITGELHDCVRFDPDAKYYECASNRNCEECISKWMNSDKW